MFFKRLKHIAAVSQAASTSRVSEVVVSVIRKSMQISGQSKTSPYAIRHPGYESVLHAMHKPSFAWVSHAHDRSFVFGAYYGNWNISFLLCFMTPEIDFE